MKTLEQQKLDELGKVIKTNSHQSPIILYFISLLFAIALHINWLTITFSCLLGLSIIVSIFVKLNKKYKWIQLKK